MRCLCDPRVKPDFIPKIIRALSQASPELVVKFVRFAKPALQEEESLDIYLRALCTQSITVAWNYTRTFPEIASEDAQRCRLVWTVLEYCLIRELHPLRSASERQLICFTSQAQADRINDTTNISSYNI